MPNEDAIKLSELIDHIEIAMLTTWHEDGSLNSRPMRKTRGEFDGSLWFFTHHDTEKVFDVKKEQQVNLVYVDPDDEVYVSISGTATVVEDKEKMTELWTSKLSNRFPDGIDDPNIALLKVTVKKAEIWDSPNPIVVLENFGAHTQNDHSLMDGREEKMVI